MGAAVNGDYDFFDCGELTEGLDDLGANCVDTRGAAHLKFNLLVEIDPCYAADDE